MPSVERPDGVRIHWVERGEGQLVVLASYWSMHPSVFDPITGELEGDHRVVRYDDRGTGESTHVGPYDLDTSSSDLAAVIEAAGGPAVIVATADAVHRAVRAGARRPELVEAVVGVGLPLGRASFGESDALASSDTVVDALIEMAATDYRSALRTIVTSTNQQMSEDELRERVRMQSEHVPQEAAVPRLRAWADADSTAEAQALGDRLWLLHSPRLGGGWFPSGPELAETVARILPDVHGREVEDGLVSRPDIAGAIVRGITVRAGAGAA
jgi:pimeloyl-ACP methyl ester carboxylesterase